MYANRIIYNPWNMKIGFENSIRIFMIWIISSLLRQFYFFSWMFLQINNSANFPDFYGIYVRNFDKIFLGIFSLAWVFQNENFRKFACFRRNLCVIFDIFYDSSNKKISVNFHDLCETFSLFFSFSSWNFPSSTIYLILYRIPEKNL